MGFLPLEGFPRKICVFIFLSLLVSCDCVIALCQTLTTGIRARFFSSGSNGERREVTG